MAEQENTSEELQWSVNLKRYLKKKNKKQNFHLTK